MIRASSCICPDFNDKIQALYLRVKRLWFPGIHEQDITQQYSKFVLVERNPCIASSTSNASPIWVSAIYSSLINKTVSRLDLAKMMYQKNDQVKFKNYALTSEEDATERAIFAASASLFAPVTVTCTSKVELAGRFRSIGQSLFSKITANCWVWNYIQVKKISLKFLLSQSLWKNHNGS